MTVSNSPEVMALRAISAVCEEMPMWSISPR